MKSSELKPLLLRNLTKLFEIDPSPNAWGTVGSFANNTQGATSDQVVRMVEHLSHEGLKIWFFWMNWFRFQTVDSALNAPRSTRRRYMTS